MEYISAKAILTALPTTEQERQVFISQLKNEPDFNPNVAVDVLSKLITEITLNFHPQN